MITGAISLVILIGVIAAANNGEWGSVAIGAIIILLLLAIGAGSRKCDRAFNNMVDYWDKQGR